MDITLFRSVFTNRLLSNSIFQRLRGVDVTGKKIKKWNQLTFKWLCENRYFTLLKYWVDANYEQVELLNQTVLTNMPTTLESYDERLDQYVVIASAQSIPLFMQRNKQLDVFLSVYNNFEHLFQLGRGKGKNGPIFNLLEDACLSGNMDIVQFLLNHKFTFQDKTRAIVNAGISGNMSLVELVTDLCIPYDPISIIKEIVENGSPNAIPSDIFMFIVRRQKAQLDESQKNYVNGDFLYRLITSKHLDILKYAIEDLKVKLNPSDVSVHVSKLDYAAYAGKDMLLYIYNIYVQNNWELSMSNFGLSALIALHGKIDDEIFFKLYSSGNHNSMYTYYCQNYAAKYKNTELLHRFFKEQGTPQHPSNVALEAFQSGHLENVKFILSNYTNKSENMLNDTNERNKLALEFARSGNLNLLALLSTFGVDPPPLSKSVMTEAAKNGYIGIVKYLHYNRTEGCEPHTLAWCIAAGASQEMIDFLLNECISFLSKKSIDPIKSACEKGDILLIKKLMSYGFKLDYEALDVAAANNHLGVLQLLSEYPCSPAAMNLAAANGHLQVVHYLHFNKKVGCTTAAMDRALGNGHVDVVQFLHEHRTEGCTENGVDRALIKGQAESIKFISENRSERWTTEGMHNAITNGHFKLVRYAISVKNNLTSDIGQSYLSKGSNCSFLAIRFYYNLGYITKNDIKHMISISKNTMEIDYRSFLLSLIQPKVKYNSLDQIDRDCLKYGVASNLTDWKRFGGTYIIFK